MANISIADIKALREQLGTGMVDTKKALEEADGDLEKATEILRLKGAKGNAKRADRSTSEGLVAAKENGDTATMIELACETDFVAKGDKFIALSPTRCSTPSPPPAPPPSRRASRLPPAARPSPTSSATRPPSSARRSSCAASRSSSGEHFAIYLHKTSKDLPPQVGVVVGYAGDDAETARSIAQHISFANPEYLTREDVPAEAVENERRIVEEISRNEGKPEAALPKIIEGRLGAYFKQVALLEQDYAKDNKLTVSQVLKDAGTHRLGLRPLQGRRLTAS